MILPAPTEDTEDADATTLPARIAEQSTAEISFFIFVPFFRGVRRQTGIAFHRYIIIYRGLFVNPFAEKCPQVVIRKKFFPRQAETALTYRAGDGKLKA